MDKEEKNLKVIEKIIKEQREKDGYKITFSFANKYSTEEMIMNIIKSHL